MRNGFDLDRQEFPHGVHVLHSFVGSPDADGVLARFAVRHPATTAISHFAAFQRHDPMGCVCPERMIGGAMNRVQGLPVTRWSEAIEGGLFAVLQLADGDWLALLPIAGRHTMAWLAPDGDNLTVKVGTLGPAPVAGDLPALAWTRSENVYAACQTVWRLALRHPLMRGLGRLRDEKVYPEVFRYLGWCSWEQYRREIDAEKLAAAVRQIGKSELPVRWVLVDDGYYHPMPTGARLGDYPLRSLAPTPEKFPAGWEPILAERRHDQVRWFGLWQNFNGYWGRIAADNDLGPELNARLLEVPAGGRMPSPTLPDALAFYEAMIGTAAEAGFDFVKIDNQAQALQNYAGTANPVAAVACCAQALERVAAARVDGLVNCMAHGPINAFNTCLSAVTRCSEDYLLNDAWRAKAHLHNSYQNMLWLGPTVWGDHDMFHSSDQFAGGMMALSKALSGGPVYLSDAPDHFDATLVKPLCFADGRLLRPLAPAVPLPRSVTLDPFEQPAPYLVAAPLPNGAAAIVAYNLTEPTVPVAGEIRPADYLEAAGLLDRTRSAWTVPAEGLLLYDWRRGTAKRFVEPECFSLPEFADHFLLICPIRHGWAVIGRADKYLSPAAVEVLDVTADQILMRVDEAGPLTLWRDDHLLVVHASAGIVRV